MRLCLLADDRTGALDTGVRLIALAGGLSVYWNLDGLDGARGSLAVDLGTREASEAAARAHAARAAGLLHRADLAYLKCDSLLRGATAQEIAACLEGGAFTRCILAPAFPAQRRATRQGRQWAVKDAQGWTMVGPDLAAQLASLGIPVAARRPGDAMPDGVSLWDAETLEDLEWIAEQGLSRPGRTLWCGSAGLAQAIAGDTPPRLRAAEPPFLGLVGTDHDVTASQLAAARTWHVPVRPGDTAARDEIGRRLARGEATVVSVDLPAGSARDTAAERISETFSELLRDLPRPGTLFVTGGETLADVCAALGVEALELEGEVEAGIPVSRFSGGKWNGLRVISKSGAFGDLDLIQRLIFFAHS